MCLGRTTVSYISIKKRGGINAYCNYGGKAGLVNTMFLGAQNYLVFLSRTKGQTYDSVIKLASNCEVVNKHAMCNRMEVYHVDRPSCFDLNVTPLIIRNVSEKSRK